MGTRRSEGIMMEVLAIVCSDVHAVVCVSSVSALVSNLAVTVACVAVASQVVRAHDHDLIVGPRRGVERGWVVAL